MIAVPIVTSENGVSTVSYRTRAIAVSIRHIKERRQYERVVHTQYNGRIHPPYKSCMRGACMGHCWHIHFITLYLRAIMQTKRTDSLIRSMPPKSGVHE